MPITKVDKESVRLLAIQFGLREAARRSGLNEDRVRQWSSRNKWFVQPADTQGKSVTTVTKPGDVLLAELQDLNGKTKLGLAKYASNQAKHLSENGKLKDHNAFRNITAGASQLHGWNEGKAQNQILNVAILTGQERPERSITALDVDSEGQGSGA